MARAMFVNEPMKTKAR